MDFDNQLQTMDRPIILVVDDSDAVRTAVCKILLAQKCHAQGVENGRESLNWLEVVNPSLLILDYRLPDMNGKEVIQKINAKGWNILFIVITSNGDEKVAVER